MNSSCLIYIFLTFYILNSISFMALRDGNVSSSVHRFGPDGNTIVSQQLLNGLALNFEVTHGSQWIISIDIDDPFTYPLVSPKSSHLQFLVKGLD